MKILATCILPALLAGDLCAAVVDFSPHYIDTFIDGFKMRRLYFVEGTKKIGVSTDQETEVHSEGNGGVGFSFQKYPDARFVIENSRLTPEQPMDEGSLDTYRKAAQELLPRGAAEVKIVSEAADPLPINKWKSHRIVMSFQLGPNAMSQSVTFLNLSAEQQVVLITSSITRNFAEAAERSFQIIRTWQELLPGDERRAGGS